jgi:ribosomal protein S27AE
MSEKVDFHYRQCPGCAYDFVTGEGRRSCNWHDCPYLPEELRVICPRCNYNFATHDGNAECGDPPSCEWSKAAAVHVANARRLRSS